MEGNNNKPQVDVYDEEFYNNLQLARKMVKDIPNQTDRGICKKWIAKLLDIKSDDPVVKRNRNSFFKFLLQTLDKAVREAAITPQFDTKMPSSGRKTTIPAEFMSKWSGDNRTYIAAKPLPGQGALIYMAVSKDPSLGWDHM